MFKAKGLPSNSMQCEGVSLVFQDRESWSVEVEAGPSTS